MAIAKLDPGTQFTIKAETVLDGSGNKINLGIIYKSSLAVLLSKRIGMLNATVENAIMLGMSGVAKYYVGRRNLSRDYTAGTGTADTVSTRPITVPLDYRKEISFSFESLDLQQLGVKSENGSITVSGLLLQSWVDAKAKSFVSYLHAKLLQLGVATALANTPTAIVIKDETQDSYRAGWKLLADKIYALISAVSEEYVGIDFEDGALWVAPEIYSTLILMTTNLGSETSTQDLKDGMPSFTKIAGIKVVPAPFLGGTYAKGVLDTDEAFDFTGVNAMWVHKQSLAFPVNMGQAAVYVYPNNGNVHNFHKFMVHTDGGVALRPKLCIGFNISTAPTPPASK